MLVMKFGGSSVADGKQIEKVFEIVKGRLARKPVVVSSAHKGITNALIACGKAAAAGKPDASPVINRQKEVLVQCGCKDYMLNAHFREIEDLLRGIALVREYSARSNDYLSGFGERMSCRVIADFFTRHGIRAEAYDINELGFITDDKFGQARPIKGWEAGFKAEFDKRVPKNTVPIITGFIGKTPAGDWTTVGRNGSDFTATLVASAIDAEECEIWTDTDGVMTADPSVIPQARSIPFMSFAEASELAYYGGRVLHPSTLLPAVTHNIPVRVLNTNRPDHPGTVITQDGSADERPVTSIAYKESQCVVTIESERMLGQPGFLAKVFDVMGRHGVDIDMVTTSEISVSMTCAELDKLNAAVKELEQFGRVTITTDRTIVCIVGKNVKYQRGIGARIFAALRDAEVNVEMISQGANKINLSLLIADDDIKAAIPALHRALFES
ncbi:MAG: aspartate kinase [Planctomycetaceae bacterium]|nr:Lysine-sensitive aspartokinase 3 [Planctomycetota bacterium]NUO16099.1 aspartate kinase [Planctomycetaceae bacterium]